MEHPALCYVVERFNPWIRYVFTDKAAALEKVKGHDDWGFATLRQGALTVYAMSYEKFPDLFFFEDEAALDLFRSQ